MEVPYYELPCEGIRLIAADIRAVLKCEPPPQFPDCMNELRRGLARFQEDQIDESRSSQFLTDAPDPNQITLPCSVKY